MEKARKHLALFLGIALAMSLWPRVMWADEFPSGSPTAGVQTSPQSTEAATDEVTQVDDVSDATDTGESAQAGENDLDSAGTGESAQQDNTQAEETSSDAGGTQENAQEVTAQSESSDDTEATSTSVVITKQPASATVEYPAGASFSVEVEDPSTVASYQWYMSDGSNTKTLNGTSATTATLVVPATTQDDPVCKVWCTITGTDGSETDSDRATLKVGNPGEDKDVLYIADRALCPGETIDLSTTELGSGTISFAANGSDVTLDHVTLNSTPMQFDYDWAPATCLMLSRNNTPQSQYHIHVVGDCLLNNTYYDPEMNACGITLNLAFGTEDVMPKVIIDGSGTLTLAGGTVGLYSLGDIELKTGLVTRSYETVFGDAIQCNQLTIAKDVTATLAANGTGVSVEGGLVLEEGSTLDISTSLPHVVVGPSAKGAIFLVGDLSMDHATLNIVGTADPERFVPYESSGSLAGILMGGEGSVFAADSTITIDLGAAHSSSEPYAYNFSGILGTADGNSLSFSNTTTSITVKSPDIVGASGVYLYGDVTVDASSQLTVVVDASGDVMGLAPEGQLNIADSVVDVLATSASGESTSGILCGGADISLSRDEQYVKSVATGGLAFAANTGETGDDPVSFTEGYKASKVTLGEGVACITPKKNALNLWSVPGSMSNYVHVEAYYDLKDTSVPAAEVLITRPEITYAFTKGAKSSWKKWSAHTLNFKVSRSFADDTTLSHFSAVKVDGEKVDAKGYEVSSGSLKLALKPAYLNGLETGSHELEVSFDDGSASTSFTVKAASSQGGGGGSRGGSLPNTKDPSDVSAMGATGFLGLGLAMWGLRRQRAL